MLFTVMGATCHLYTIAIDCDALIMLRKTHISFHARLYGLHASTTAVKAAATSTMDNIWVHSTDLNPYKPISLWLRCFTSFNSCRDYTKDVSVLEPIGQVEVQASSCYELDLACVHQLLLQTQHDDRRFLVRQTRVCV